MERMEGFIKKHAGSGVSSLFPQVMGREILSESKDL